MVGKSRALEAKKGRGKGQGHLELQQIQERAVALAEQNAILQRELNLAWRSISGTSSLEIPSTSTASVGGQEVHELGRNEIGFSTPIGGAIASMPPASGLATTSLRAYSGRAQIYPRLKHSPSPLELQFFTPEDSLRFQIEEDVDATRLAEGVCGLSSHVAGTHILEVSRAGNEDEVGVGDEDEEEEDSDGEEEEGEKGNGEDQEDRLDYGSSPKAGGGESEAHPCSRIWSEVHIV